VRRPNTLSNFPMPGIERLPSTLTEVELPCVPLDPRDANSDTQCQLQGKILSLFLVQRQKKLVAIHLQVGGQLQEVGKVSFPGYQGDAIHPEMRCQLQERQVSSVPAGTDSLQSISLLIC